MEGFRLEPIVSRTFQKWVHDHEDEIDECELNFPPSWPFILYLLFWLQ